MALLPVGVALAILVRTLVYLHARLKANPKTRDMVSMVLDPQALLHAAMASRNKAENHALEAQAQRDQAEEAFTDALVPLGQRLAATFGGDRAHPGYLRVFHKAPSALALTPQRDQLVVFGKLLHALQDAQTPAELAPHVQELARLFAELELADKHDQQATFDFGAAVKNLGKVRTICLDAIAQVQGELQKRFPRDSKRVRRFFPPVTRRAKAEAATGEGGDGSQGGDK